MLKEGGRACLGVVPSSFWTLPSSVLFPTLMRSLKCSSSVQESPAGVGMQEPCSKATPAGRARFSSPLGVRMWRAQSPPVTATSAGLLDTFFLESSRRKHTKSKITGAISINALKQCYNFCKTHACAVVISSEIRAY